MSVTENKYSKLIEVMSSVFSSFPLGDNLMRSIKTEETEELKKEKVFVTATFGGGISIHVKNGRVIKTDPLTIPEDVRQYRIEARGKVFEPPRKCLPDMWGHAYRRWVYDPNRVRYPLKRVGWQLGGKGRYDNRGLAEFVRISWDEALELVSQEVKRIKETYGNSAITYKDVFHTSWGTLHGMGTEFTIIPRFLNILGGFTEYVVGTASWPGWATGASFMYGFWWANGTSEGQDTLTDCLQNSRMIVYWSLDPTKSARMYHGHETEIWRHWIREAGIKTVMISPEINDTAATHADRWVPIYPGYDAAMAAAIMYVWIREDTYDKEYVKTHTVGFKKLRDYLLGKEDGIPKTPEWAEKICDVNAETIIGLAREWAAGPTAICCQLGGANRGWYGHEWARMMVALVTLQGLGKPGVHLISLGWASGGAPYDKSIRMPGYTTGIKMVETKSYANPIPQKVHALNWADCIVNPPVKWRGGTSGATYWEREFPWEYNYPKDGYSEVKMLFRTGGGHFTSYPNINWRVQGYLSPKLETIVVTALFMEPLMRYADIILPACTDFERDDISLLGCAGMYLPYAGSTNHQIAIYYRKCIERIGQSMSDLEIYYNLAKKLGIYEELSEGNTEEDWIRKLFESSSLSKLTKYEDFKKKGYYIFPYPENYEPTPAFRWFYEKGEGLATPSGKIEIYSKVLADFYGENHPEIAPIPKYIEPKDGKNSPLAKEYPLVGFCPHPKFRFHTMMENVTWLRKLHKMKGPKGEELEPIWINPVDAAARGIKNGDAVVAFNDKGETLAGAYVTERIKPGTLRIFYGSFWEPEDPRNPGSLDRGGSGNILTSNAPQSYHCYLHRKQHMMVDVRKWERQS
jgi:molybdopterin guanine dinucleotide-containing S/N-oxide reductase-like protein